jgi:hypothetical protein
MPLPYREGTWFAVPLKRGGYGAGVVARATADGRILLGYFFGPRHPTVPRLTDVRSLQPQEAALVVHFGDLSLIDRNWPILGQAPSWDRRRWKSPDFVRTDPLSGRAWLVHYDDRDPSVVVSEKPIVKPDPTLSRNGLFGAGAVESVLDRKLA